MRVQAIPDAFSLTVRRAVRGTSAVSHASSAAILIHPAFLDVEILDSLNEGLDACFPLLYRPISLEYTGIVDPNYEYLVPNMSGIGVPIPYLSEIEFKETGDPSFHKDEAWWVVRGETPFIKFRRQPVAGSRIRISGYGPFTHLQLGVNPANTLDAFFPVQAEYLPTLYAAAMLLASGEAGRVRVDTGVIDDREQANRTGSSMAASDKLLQRFYKRLNDSAMPPMPKHVVSVF
jgi:hypothetical protein